MITCGFCAGALKHCMGILARIYALVPFPSVSATYITSVGREVGV